MPESFERFEKPSESFDNSDDALRRHFRPGSQEGDLVEPGEWVDRGIQETPVEAVDLSDSYVHSEVDFKKVSHEEMARGFETLEKEVRPAVANGADGDYFSRLDEQRGLEYKDGTRRIYDAFYGNDAIRLNKVGDRYEVINGYHRLHVANELGVSAVPARVIEKR